MSDASTSRWSPDATTPLTAIRDTLSTRLFSTAELLLIPTVFAFLLAALNIGFKLLNTAVFDGSLDVAPAWPISVYYVHTVWHPIPLYLGTIIAATTLFAGLTWWITTSDSTRLTPVIGGGTLLILATTLIQGVGPGFVGPVAGSRIADYGAPGIQDGHQYYHQALHVTDPLAFISNYATAQPDLVLHATTHPPGAVLTYYLFHELLGTPALITVAIAVLATTITAYSLYHLLTTYVTPTTAQYTTFLFLLLPSIQIYYASSIDALITAFLTAGIYYFTQHDSWRSHLGAITCLFVASFQTFLFVFILPVVLAYELHTHHSIKRSTIIVAGLAAIYAGLYLTLDFNYLQSFVVATTVENSGGFQLVTAPANYLVTRLENIAEILLFFTPYLTWLLIRGRDILNRRSDIATLAIAAIGSLTLLFLGGVYQTGETARGAMYIYPFLILPIAAYLDDLDVDTIDHLLLATVVFGQTIAMQIVGFYFW